MAPNHGDAMTTHAEMFEARIDGLVAQGVYKSKGAARRGLATQGDLDALVAQARDAHYAAGNPAGSHWLDRIEAGLAGVSPSLA